MVIVCFLLDLLQKIKKTFKIILNFIYFKFFSNSLWGQRSYGENGFYNGSSILFTSWC